MGPTATSLAPLVAPVSAPLLPPENRREDKRRRTRQSSPSIAASTVLVADTVSSDGTESPAELFRMSNRSFSLADSASNTAAANTTPLRRSAEPTLLNRSHFPLSSTPRSAPSTPPTPGEASFSGQSSSDEIRGRVSEIIDSLPCLTLSPSTKSPVSKPVHVDGPLKGKFGPGKGSRMRLSAAPSADSREGIYGQWWPCYAAVECSLNTLHRFKDLASSSVVVVRTSRNRALNR